MTRHNITSMEDTKALARHLAAQLRAGDVLLLQGDLGAGKTALARAIIMALNPAVAEVPSPTFTLVQPYDTPAGAVFHYDLYRLKYEDEIIELGWDENRANGITLVEWPERLGRHTPRDAKKALLMLGADGIRWAETEGFEGC